MPELPPPALAFCFFMGHLPPPWFVPIEAPACGVVLEVPPEANDGIALRFVCDKITGHADRPDVFPDEARPRHHRQVTDNDEGDTIQWLIEEEQDA